jgi:hypothetical protein
MLNVIQIPQMAQRAQKRWQQLGPLLIFSRFQDAFRDIIRQLSNSELDEDGVDSIIFRLEQLSVHLVRLCNVDLMTTVKYAILRHSTSKISTRASRDAVAIQAPGYEAGVGQRLLGCLRKISCRMTKSIAK